MMMGSGLAQATTQFCRILLHIYYYDGVYFYAHSSHVSPNRRYFCAAPLWLPPLITGFELSRQVAAFFCRLRSCSPSPSLLPLRSLTPFALHSSAALALSSSSCRPACAHAHAYNGEQVSVRVRADHGRNGCSYTVPDSCICSLIHSFQVTHPATHPPAYSPTCTLTGSLTHPLAYSHIH
eukprot:712958-Pleurochrysis_carterae.AAC.1